MTQVMGKTSARDHLDFALMLGFGIASLMRRPSQWSEAARVLAGYVIGAGRMLLSLHHG